MFVSASLSHLLVEGRAKKYLLPVGSTILIGRESLADSTIPYKLKLGIDPAENGISRSQATLKIRKDGRAIIAIKNKVPNPILWIPSNGREPTMLKAGRSAELCSGDIFQLDSYNVISKYSYVLHICKSEVVHKDPYKEYTINSSLVNIGHELAQHGPSKCKENFQDMANSSIELRDKDSGNLNSLDIYPHCDFDAENPQDSASKSKHALDDLHNLVDNTKNDQKSYSIMSADHHETNHSRLSYPNKVCKRKSTGTLNKSNPARNTFRASSASGRHTSNIVLHRPLENMHISCDRDNVSSKIAYSVDSTSMDKSDVADKLVLRKRSLPKISIEKVDAIPVQKPIDSALSNMLSVFLGIADPGCAMSACIFQITVKSRHPNVHLMEDLLETISSRKSDLIRAQMALHCLNTCFTHIPKQWQPNNWMWIESLMSLEHLDPDQIFKNCGCIELISRVLLSILEDSGKALLLTSKIFHEDMIKRTMFYTVIAWQEWTINEENALLGRFCWSLTKLMAVLIRSVIRLRTVRERTVAFACMDMLSPMSRDYPRTLFRLLCSLDAYHGIPSVLVEMLLNCIPKNFGEIRITDDHRMLKSFLDRTAGSNNGLDQDRRVSGASILADDI